MTIAELRILCVNKITGSLTRRPIMDSLEDVIDHLNRAAVRGEVWVDGSFATEKIDPEDVDILVRTGASQYDNEASARAAVDWASAPDRFTTHSCDAYKWVEYDSKHPLFAISEDDRIYWSNWFGKSRRGVPKGIPVISLLAGTP